MCVCVGGWCVCVGVCGCVSINLTVAYGKAIVHEPPPTHTHFSVLG